MASIHPFLGPSGLISPSAPPGEDDRFRPDLPIAGQIVCNLPNIKFTGTLPMHVMFAVLTRFFPDGSWRDFVYDYNAGSDLERAKKDRGLGIRSRKYYLYEIHLKGSEILHEPDELPWLAEDNKEWRDLLIQIKII